MSNLTSIISTLTAVAGVLTALVSLVQGGTGNTLAVTIFESLNDLDQRVTALEQR